MIQAWAEKGGQGQKLWGQRAVKRLAFLGRAQTYSSDNQVQDNLESGRDYGSESGSDSKEGSDIRSGRITRKSMGLSLGQMGTNPIEENRPFADWPDLLDYKGHETCFMGGELGLKQGPALWLSMPSECRISTSRETNIAEEGIKEISMEEGELREESTQEDDCVPIERYVNNYNVQFPSSRLSVFGRPLLQGDSLGRGVPLGIKIWK